MLTKEQLLEMAINTINSFNEKLGYKDELTLCDNYGKLIRMYMNYNEQLSTVDYNIIIMHKKFFEEFLKLNIERYNQSLVNLELKESSQVMSIIRNVQGLIEYELYMIK